MLPIHTKNFKPYQNNPDILICEFADSSSLKGYIKSLEKEDKVILVQCKKRTKQNNAQLKALEDEASKNETTLILIEDV